MTKASETEEQIGIQLKEFGIALSQIAEEKGISEERVLETVEAALSAAYKKDYGQRGQFIRAEFDKEFGSAKFFLVKEVVDETTREFYEEKVETEDREEVKVEEKKKPKKEKYEEESEEESLPRFNPERDITLKDAKKEKKGAKLGDIIETELESHDTFGRVAAQTAKQVIIQKIREAERESMFKEYKEREGEVVNGTIQRIEGRTVFVDLGKSTGVMPVSEQVRSERYRMGQRLRVYVASVESDPRGPGITLSRASQDLVRGLFELEVPEIFAGTVVIKGIAREAGSRTKIAVHSSEDGIDPVGSCVGQKGTRVESIRDEINGEKIDIIEWNENVEDFITASLSPAKVVSTEIHEEEKSVKVFVAQDQLSLAIGKQGQNVRLASQLTGYTIDIIGANIAEENPDGDKEEEVLEESDAPQEGSLEEKKDVAQDDLDTKDTQEQKNEKKKKK